MAKIKYVSSQGVEFNLLSFEYCKLYKADFHKVKWKTETVAQQYGTLVNRFKKDAISFSCTFRFTGSHDQRKKQIDDFVFQTEYDICKMVAGRIYWDDQYIGVFMTDHDCKPVNDGMNWTEVTATFYAPYPFWIEERKIIIRPSEGASEGFPENVIGYPEDRDWVYGYEYAYPYAKNAVSLRADSPLESDFKAVIYGPAALVQFNVNGHTYKVDYPLRINQYMVIDTRAVVEFNKRCYVRSSNGSEVNVFNYRDPSSSLFKKLPSGNFVFSFQRNYGIDLYIFQERSAPK